MSKLEELRKMVHESFTENTPEEIKKMALIENKINEIQKDEEEMLNKQKELVKDYKELLFSQGNNKKVPEDNPTGVMPSFEDALNQFVENEKEKEK